MAWNTERLWERQNDESGKAYEAFGVYRDMGAARTVSAVARQLRKSRALIDRWKRQWNWEERARAYDRELERAAYEEAVKAMREMSRRPRCTRRFSASRRSTSPRASRTAPASWAHR